MSDPSLDGGDPPSDFRRIFSETEFVEAVFLLTGDREKASLVGADVYGDPDPGWIMFGDLITALSALSADAARRVQWMMRESDAEAAARLGEFMTRRAREGGLT
jgi:hypothetical protein